MRRFLPVFALALIASLPASARAVVTLNGVEGMTATVFQEHQTSFSGLGLRTSFESDDLISGFSFLPGIEYWRNSTSVKQFAIDAERRDATLAFDARYTFTYKGIAPFLGAGFGVHFLTTEVRTPTLGHAETSLIKGGLSGSAGALVPLTGKLRNFVELKYHHVTDYRQFKLNLGIAWVM